jgi:flagellar basal-body rod modification protein FlgD
MASAVNSLLGSSSNTNSTSNPSSSSTSSTGASSPPSEEMFLQLLVAQMQNQDPLNPTDSTQFVTQLAQFSELEQVVAIRSDIETYHAEAASASSGTNPAAGSTDNTPASDASNTTPGTSETPAVTMTSNPTSNLQS